MDGKGIFAKVAKVKNTLVNLIMEEEVEIVDNGLDEIEESTEKDLNKNYNKEKDVVVNDVENRESVEELKDEENKNKSKMSFMKAKQKTLEEDLFNEEEKTTMELIKANPEPMVEIIESKKIEKFPAIRQNFKYEKAQNVVENYTEELTNEQKEAEEFYAKMDAREAIIKNLRKQPIFKDVEQEIFGEGLEDTFYSLMNEIEENDVLEASQKLEKMNQVRVEFYKVDDTSEEEVYNYFKMIRHELHKVKNRLGEYNKSVNKYKNTHLDFVLDYKVADMYENSDTKKMLLEADMRNFSELISLTEAMIFKIDENSLLKTMPEKSESFKNEYVDMLWYSNNICDVIIGIEMLKMDISDINNNKGRFSKTVLLEL